MKNRKEMLSAVLILSFISSLAAFSVVNNYASTKLSMSAEGMSKSLPFLKKPKNLDGLVGNSEFDPFGFAEQFDVKFMREAELKHGRIAMLATVGWLVQSAGIHLPSPDGLYDKANPIDAFFHVGPSPIAQIFFFIGALESINHNGQLGMSNMFEGVNKDREPGAFTLPIYGASQLKGKTQAYIDDIKLKELKNGRLAMLAIGGLVHQQIVTGSETLGSFPNPSIWSLY